MLYRYNKTLCLWNDYFRFSFLSRPPSFKLFSIHRTMPKKKTIKKTSVKRASVGRPKGSGKFGCETKVIRVPVHIVDEIFDFVRRKIKLENKGK